MPRPKPGGTPASPGALGRCRWEKTLPCPPCTITSSLPSAPQHLYPHARPVGALWDQSPSGEEGRTLPREPFPPPTLRFGMLLGSSLRLLAVPAPGSAGRAGGFSVPAVTVGCSQFGVVPGCTETLLSQQLLCWDTPHRAFTCAPDGEEDVDRTSGERGPGPHNTLPLDSPHLSAPRSRPQTLLQLTVTPASSGVSPWAWLPSHRLG